MRDLSDSDFLRLWETGLALHPLDRGLLVLSRVFSDLEDGNPADWPLGRRNRVLAEWRLASFGARIQGWVSCAHCGDKLEFEMDGRVLAGEGSRETVAGETVTVRGATFRLPSSRDLSRLLKETDSSAAALRLAQGCLLEAGESPIWSQEYLEEVGERMAQADPLAETRLKVNCPQCANACEENLDILSFLWAEIEGRARHVLAQIHALATAYGWTESQILSLSGSRRNLYLGLVES